MSRKNTILGLGALAAFGFASMAFAQCPSSPVPPWSSVSALGGSVAIADGGYDGTSCRLDTAITTNIGGASAFVRDDTPSDEPSYRAQFLVDADSLTGLNAIQSVNIFSALTEAGFGGVTSLVRVGIQGNFSGTATLGVSTVCEGEAANTCGATTALSAGVNRIEIAYVKGGNPSLQVWVNNTSESSPTLELNGNNSSWGGVDYATLGLSAPSPGFRTAQANRTVGFDEFDSRRTTFIGN